MRNNHLLAKILIFLLWILFLSMALVSSVNPDPNTNELIIQMLSLNVSGKNPFVFMIFNLLGVYR